MSYKCNIKYCSCLVPRIEEPVSFVKFSQNVFLEELEFCMLFSTLHNVKKYCSETLLVTTLGPFLS